MMSSTAPTPTDSVNFPAIKVCDVTVRLGQQILFKNISFEVQHREKFFIIGPSGEGKTVLLKTLAGLIKPVSGQVFVEGECWQNLQSDEKHELAKKVGVLFQQNALFDELTAYQNVAFPLQEHTDLTAKQIGRHVVSILEEVGLLSSQNLFPHELSGGMQRRLGIARAMALKPDIMFFDDPTAGQDPINSDRMVQLILSLQKATHSTLVTVTNDIELALAAADRLAMVIDKKVVLTGTPEQTRQHPDKKVQQFIKGDLTGPLTRFLLDRDKRS